MAIDKKVIAELLKGYKGPEDMIGEDGVLKQITKAVLETAMEAEMTEHLGYEKHDPAGHNTGNSRNGTITKNLKGDFGEIELETPRDRAGEFEPRLVRKHQTRWTGFDEKILSMYAPGMTTRDIQAHLKEMYGTDVSPTLISEVTDQVMEQARAWQTRPLEPIYPIVFLDALYVKMRHEGRVENRAVYVAVGITLEGTKEVLGLWTNASEGAKFWLAVLTELRNRGVKDILLACVDGLKGFPQAIESQYPKTQVQLCIVHLIRASLNYVTWKDRKKAVMDLKPIYKAATAEQAALELEEFSQKWAKYPAITRLWRDNWERVIPFFAFPAEVRKIVYTTNAVESLHMSVVRRWLRTAMWKNCGIGPIVAYSKQMDTFLSALADWAARESEMLAVAVVGSHARGSARADSDVDVVLLVANPERYFVSADWIKRFGEICSFRDEDWGRLRSRRVYYASGLEVEFGFSDAAWASTDPVDSGTRSVVAGGLLCVYDPQNILRLLAAACSLPQCPEPTL